ncbi:nicotinamide-nucleotide adenylyltransferase, NadR type [Nonlabens sp. Hel1_33_55]|uniref:AAA family ATPase n=1 Tax=Nonlabens sp. Hel1_33_55 TaxID=1336802 RepID=UPI000875CCEF|nr:ATP-binding protein [Nonlabens sp. Hel1_33_55]SCY36286.1 nicotinamide-nucleotide adenylyltransferase, NadR type [Nonlabens sp. Hel1_33_55]
MEKIPEQTHFSGLRIVLYGPESTGKSTLAQQLSAHYREPQVEEFARDYLQELFDQNGHICTYDDILPIAIGQRTAENIASAKANKFLFCDTDIVETYVYSMAYFDKVPAELIAAIKKSKYDHYVLLDVDTPWTDDDLRDKPNERKEMFNRFEAALQEYGYKYTKVSGLGENRLKNAINAIEKLI